MAFEYNTVKFPNDAQGLKKKNEVTAQMAAEGWRIQSENIETGKYNGPEACCRAIICLPCAFLTGRSSGFIVVTYEREAATHADLVHCNSCGAAIPAAATFCRKCGKPASI